MIAGRGTRAVRSAGALAAAVLALGVLRADSCRVIIGTRQDGPGRGISVAQFDLKTGELSTPRLVAETPQPVFWVGDDAANHVYFCHGLDRFEDRAEGFISAFRVVADDDALVLINQVAIGGRGASHVNLDHSGQWLPEASYRSGHVAVFGLRPDGGIGPRTALVQHTGRSIHPSRQTSPHPHAIYPDPTNRYLLVPDLGLDKILVYRFDATAGTITPHDPAALELPPGSGPRHLAWHPDGRRAFATLELSNAVAALSWDAARGTLSLRQTVSTLPEGFAGENTAAEVAVHPSGNYVYASNRGADNSIVVFAVDSGPDPLAAIERVSSRGQWPRNFSIDRSGRWMVVSNHDSDSLAVFSIDRSTGRLTPVGEPVAAPHPFGTRFLEPRR